MKKSKVNTLVHVAVLVALQVVLTRFCSIQTPITRIGFGFVPIAVCGMLFGPVWAGAAAGVGDLLGMLLFPTGGAFFPGFTLSTALSGVIFGLCLRRKNWDWRHLALAVALHCLGISLCLNTLWLSIMRGTPFLVLLPTRVLQNIIVVPVQFIVLKVIRQPITRLACRSITL